MRALGYRLAHEAFVRAAVVGIATTGGRFQSPAVEHGHFPAMIFDQAFFLQGAGSGGDSDPAYTEHVGEEFVSHTERVRVRTILHHQQPAAETRIDLMKSRTGGGRGELSH